MTREKAIEILDEVIPPPGHHTVDLDHLRIAQAWLCIKETLTAEPVKHGRWVWLDGVRCSICNHKLQTTGLPSYCPNCGAKMDEEASHEQCTD